MKAFACSSSYSEGSIVVFAETANKARAMTAHSDGFEYDEYTDIHARRLPLLDGMENCEPKDSYWLNDEIRTILVRDYGWTCAEPNEYEPCEECCAKSFCSYYESQKGDE